MPVTFPVMSDAPDRDLAVAARFWRGVVRVPGRCWIWSGSKMWFGYGQFRMDRHNMNAQRAAWLLERGPIPEGLFVCHRCDEPACVNPDHLFLGSPLDNMTDMIRKGRHDFSGLRLGAGTKPYAKLTPADVWTIRAGLRRGLTQLAMARQHGVSETAISDLHRGRTWKDT